jgi:hypothetical protein
MKTTMTKAEVIWTTNEWWRRYRDEPERFGWEFQAVAEVTEAEAQGRDPSLGLNAWNYSLFLLSERKKRPMVVVKTKVARSSTGKRKR